MSIGKGLLITLELFLLISFANAFFLNVSNAGNILGTLIAATLLLITIFWRQFSGFILSIWEHIPGKIFLCTAALILAAGICLCGFLTVKMISAANNPPQTPCTAVVLGCKVKGTEPSLMLKRRLEEAYGYLEENPEVMCIVSGGKGEGEDISEAEAMKNYLTEKGIDESRILMEDRSTDTHQNISYSQEILLEMDMAEEVVIITDGFHQYRASLIAEELGLESYSISCRTRTELIPTYWLRELLALVREIFLK